MQELRAAGHEAFAPTLTGQGERVHLASPEVGLDTHVQDIVNLLRYELLENVILVGISYGGTVTAGVAEVVPERIAHMVYLDAFVPQDGESTFDLLGPEMAGGMEQAAQELGDGWRIPFHDPSADRRTDVMLRMAKQPLSVSNPEAARIRRTYVLHTERSPDWAWLKPIFDKAVARVHEMGGTVLERAFEHYPALDQEGGSHLVAEALLRAGLKDQEASRRWRAIAGGGRRPRRNGQSVRVTQAITQGGNQMSLESNKAVVRRHTEMYWNQGRLDLADEVHTSDMAFYDADSPALRGSEAYDQFATMYRTAFPDIHFTIEEMFAEGDMVAQRWTCTGTQRGELMGIAPTGKAVVTVGIDLFRIGDGKIAEQWVNWSMLSMLQQLGVIPPMGG